MRLSLAGVQHKLPVVFEGGRIGLPRGDAASTLILKPAGNRRQASRDANKASRERVDILGTLEAFGTPGEHQWCRSRGAFRAPCQSLPPMGRGADLANGADQRRGRPRLTDALDCLLCA